MVLSLLEPRCQDFLSLISLLRKANALTLRESWHHKVFLFGTVVECYVKMETVRQNAARAEDRTEPMQFLRHYAIASLIAVLIFSTTTSSQRQEYPPEQSQAPPTKFGGITERMRLVIRDRDKFDELWQQLNRFQSYKPPLPEVDFSREMILVAAMGQQPTSGYEIILDSACELDHQLEVVVRSTNFLKCEGQLRC